MCIKCERNQTSPMMDRAKILFKSKTLIKDILFVSVTACHTMPRWKKTTPDKLNKIICLVLAHLEQDGVITINRK